MTARQRAATLELCRRKWRDDPDKYRAEVLKCTWTDFQLNVARLSDKHRRLLIQSHHGFGKTHLLGGLANRWYDSYDPGLVIATAPTKAQVTDALWKEIKLQRGKRRQGMFPKAAAIMSSPDHWLKCFTATDGPSFQGRHEEHVLIIFDECVGIDREFWDAAEGMLISPARRFVGICNPTDVQSFAYEAATMRPEYHTVAASALDHPNIISELAGGPMVIRGAVSLLWLTERLKAWCEEIPATSINKATDFEFPPDSGTWYRPNAEFESRVLGRWPSSTTNSIWSDAAWQLCQVEREVDASMQLSIGCDVALQGDDWTAIHVCRGRTSLHHETFHGWKAPRIAERLKELATMYCEVGEDPRDVPIGIDSDGVGGAVLDWADDFNFIPLGASASARERDKYPNARSEFWFASAEEAKDDEIDLSRLKVDDLARLKSQLFTPKWSLNSKGQRVVEPKLVTKKKLKPQRSPDDADAFNLARYVKGEARRFRGVIVA